jgi:hypothetical protein
VLMLSLALKHADDKALAFALSATRSPAAGHFVVRKTSQAFCPEGKKIFRRIFNANIMASQVFGRLTLVSDSQVEGGFDLARSETDMSYRLRLASTLVGSDDSKYCIHSSLVY